MLKDERQQRILAMRFYQGKTQMETAAEIGISQPQVSRLEKGAIACIKREMCLPLLRSKHYLRQNIDNLLQI